MTRATRICNKNWGVEKSVSAVLLEERPIAAYIEQRHKKTLVLGDLCKDSLRVPALVLTLCVPTTSHT